MFVLKSKYENLRTSEILHKTQLEILTKMYNDLVARVNSRGGEQFLRNAVYPPPQVQSQFTREEIQKLIQLCHPDKHDGKQMAHDITQKLLKLKEK